MPARALTNHALRAALLRQLAPGRAITTTELRTHLDRNGFEGVTQETVYRHLDALARAGDVRRIAHPARRRIFWSRRHAAISALSGQELDR